MAQKSVRIVALSGSIRHGSFNTRLLRVAVEAAVATGADVTRIDLADYPLPVYNGDLEKIEGIPDAARRLKKIFRGSDGLLIASPEYNSSITALLKNTLDWVSRAENRDEPPLSAYRGKVAGLLGASPGRLGALRSLMHLRAILANIGVHVIPEQRTIAFAAKAFDADGNLVDEADRKAVVSVVTRLIETAGKLRSPVATQ